MLEAWREMESEGGDEERVSKVTAKMPKRVKKKRPVQTDDGEDAGWEEFYDYIFPEEVHHPKLSILYAAIISLSSVQKWRINYQ